MDEETRTEFLAVQEMASKMMAAKWDWHVDQVLTRARFAPKDILEDEHDAKELDDWMRPRMEFMYSYADFYQRRKVVRAKFIQEMDKKTTMEDIGENLDEIILDSKARYGKYYHAKKHFNEIPEIATHSYGSANFDWKERMMKNLDETRPSWFDDHSERCLEHPVDYDFFVEAKEQVAFNDKHRDNSFAALTPEENHEISLFHTMK